MSYSRGRVDRADCNCRRCKRFRQHAARGLCNSCYAIERRAGRLDQWSLTGLGDYQRSPVPPAGPPDPARDCAWCNTPLTRTRTRFGESLYEVFQIAGELVAVCFEGCPEARQPRQWEVFQRPARARRDESPATAAELIERLRTAPVPIPA